jgi:hypothetical protein
LLPLESPLHILLSSYAFDSIMIRKKQHLHTAIIQSRRQDSLKVFRFDRGEESAPVCSLLGEQAKILPINPLR